MSAADVKKVERLATAVRPYRVTSDHILGESEDRQIEMKRFTHPVRNSRQLIALIPTGGSRIEREMTSTDFIGV